MLDDGREAQSNLPPHAWGTVALIGERVQVGGLIQNTSPPLVLS